MPAPRFHPLVRLICCGLGLILVECIFALVPFLGSVMATIWLGHPPSQPVGAIAQRYALPLQIVAFVLSLMWVWYCRTRLDRHSLASLGLRGARALSNALRGALAGALAVASLGAILWLCGALQVNGWSDAIREGGLARALPTLLGYLLIFAGVAFIEELLFRGYALHNLNDLLDWKTAVGVQAGVFAAIHLPNVMGGTAEDQISAVGALPSLMLVAVFFALSYRKTGSLWFPIGFHLAWNFCLGPLLSLSVSGFETFHLLDVTMQGPLWLTGGVFGAEGSFLLIPLLGALVYFISRAPDHPQALLDLELSERDLAMVPPPAAMPVSSDESDEELRENRFRTKFGSSQGFSAETLLELRQLQEERERAEREAQEAARRDQLITSSFALTPATAPVSLEIAPHVAPAATEPLVQTVTPPPAAPSPTVPSPPQKPVVKPPTPAPVAPTPSAPASPVPALPKAEPASDAPIKKKPPSPRW